MEHVVQGPELLFGEILRFGGGYDFEIWQSDLSRLAMATTERLVRRYGGEDLPAARRGGRQYHSLSSQLIEHGNIQRKGAAGHWLHTRRRGAGSLRLKAMFDCR